MATKGNLTRVIAKPIIFCRLRYLSAPFDNDRRRVGHFQVYVWLNGWQGFLPNRIDTAVTADVNRVKLFAFAWPSMWALSMPLTLTKLGLLFALIYLRLDITWINPTASSGPNESA